MVMRKFRIRWTPAGVDVGSYVTRRQPNHKPYAQNPADPNVQTWQTRRAAEKFLSLKNPTWAAHCQVVEEPPFWRVRNPETSEEWDQLADFFGEASGKALREQTLISDRIISEIIAEENNHL